MTFLGIGSNLSSEHGDRFFNIKLAISFLDSYGIKVIKVSSFYETPSYPDKSNPKFINVVIQVDTKLPPQDLASVLIYIEEKFERKENPLDVVMKLPVFSIYRDKKINYENQSLNFKYNSLDFVVPHKELKNRNFVLIPLKEICANWIHPETKENIDSLIKKLSEEDRKSILKIENN